MDYEDKIRHKLNKHKKIIKYLTKVLTQQTKAYIICPVKSKKGSRKIWNSMDWNLMLD